jgi:hypothetical protein
LDQKTIEVMIAGLFQLLKMVWALPNSIIGLVIGLLNMAVGGRVQVRRGCLEFFSGVLPWSFEQLPNGPIAAMTLGHVILGNDQRTLHKVRDHEHVHVRQYERWGPLFLPAYFVCCILVYFRGGDPYRDNPFEKEAFSKFP